MTAKARVVKVLMYLALSRIFIWGPTGAAADCSLFYSPKVLYKPYVPSVPEGFPWGLAGHGLGDILVAEFSLMHS